MYAAGAIVNPLTPPQNTQSFFTALGGTSGMTEPTWPGRYPGVVDNSVTWVPYTVILPQTLRDINTWDSLGSGYSDTVLGNHLLDAIGELEKATRRYFVNKPGFTYQITSNGSPIIPIGGCRSATSVTWQGAVQVAGTPGGGGGGYFLLPDDQQTGVATSIQFRPLRSPDTNGPWWLSLGGSTTNWFDTAADNPFDPRNYGGGYVYASVALDTVIVGDFGYEPGSEPNPFVHALEVLASWEQMRPQSLLADSAITPQGGILTFSSMPPEVRAFVTDWSSARQVVGIG